MSYEKDYFAQWRSPAEKAEDEARENHKDGYCQGAPDCFLCQEEKEEAEREECKSHAPHCVCPLCLKWVRDPQDARFFESNEPEKGRLCGICAPRPIEDEQKERDEITKKANARASDILGGFFAPGGPFDKMFKVS